jgi:hypothetical protein
MKIGIRKITSIPFQKISDQYKRTRKKAAGIEKKIAFARNNSFRGYYL